MTPTIDMFLTHTVFSSDNEKSQSLLFAFNFNIYSMYLKTSAIADFTIREALGFIHSAVPPTARF